MTRKLCGLFSVAVMLIAFQAHAATLSFDFTAGEGFSNGFLNGQNGVLSQGDGMGLPGGYSVDTSGSGTISTQNDGFLRAIFFSGDVSLESFVSSSAAGETATLTLSGLTINRAAANIPVAGFGFTSSTDLGTAGNSVGLQLRANANGDILLDEQAFGDSGGALDTGFDLGQAFDVSVLITSNGDGTFDANSTVGAASLLTANNVAFSGPTVGVIFQNQGPPAGAATTTIGAVSAEANVVPEPAGLVLVGLGGLLIAGRRR